MRAVDDALEPDSAIPATRVDGGRFYIEDDPYYWVSYAQEMAETGNWRIRYTHIDNTPYGREVHWSQSFSWLLVLFGWLRHRVTDEPMAQAIETASIWVNPVLLVIVTNGFSWLICRRMGAVAAAFFAISLISVATIGWTYHPFRPDHQGLHVAFSFGAVFCLMLGGLGLVASGSSGERSFLSYFRPLTLLGAKAARGYFITAGIFSGSGLWVGATVHCFNIAIITGGCLLMILLVPSRTVEQTRYIPELWRWWAVAAAMTGFLFYLLEYFPNHLAIRLEVNNPLYLLSVLCAGELMVSATRWRLRMRTPDSYAWLKIVLMAMGAALAPLLLVFGPSALYSLHNVEMRRLYQFISELQAFTDFKKVNLIEGWFRAFGLLPVFVIGALLLMRLRRPRLHESTALWMSFFVCVFYLLLTLWQIRWAGMYAIANVWLMVLVGHVAWRNLVAKQIVKDFLGPASVAGAVVLAQAGYFIYRSDITLMPVVRRTGLIEDIMDAVMKKHLAQGLAAMSNGQSLRIICEPDLAGSLYYFGRNTSLVSYYFENLQGLHDATDFFTDHGDVVAREIARRRGLTHVLVSDDKQVPVRFNYIRTGSLSEKAAQSTLLARLRRARSTDIPNWIVRDEKLSAVGRRKFVYHAATGSVPIESRMIVYRLEPERVK
jgi:hypothetical protein